MTDGEIKSELAALDKQPDYGPGMELGNTDKWDRQTELRDALGTRHPAAADPNAGPLKDSELESMSNDVDKELGRLAARADTVDGDTDPAVAREMTAAFDRYTEDRKRLAEYRRRLNAGETSEQEYKTAVAGMLHDMLGEDGPTDGDPISALYEKFNSWEPPKGEAPGGIRTLKSARELADNGVAGKELRDALRRENPGFSNAQAHVVANKMAAEAPDRRLEAARKTPQNPDSRKILAEAGEAMPDGSFPTPNKLYFQKAVKAVGRTSEAKRPAVREYLKKRADALGTSVPDSWNDSVRDTPSESMTAKQMAAAGVTGKQLRDQLRKENPHFTNAQTHLVSRKMEAQAAADKNAEAPSADGLAPDDLLMLQMQLTPGFPDQEELTKDALAKASAPQLTTLLSRVQARMDAAGSQQKKNWQQVLDLVAAEAKKRLAGA
jgi:hypothetical protein